MRVANRVKQYNAAIYERLSKDDELAGDSTSIQNQRKILLSFVEENGFNLVGEYTDDGWSGTNFERPGFKRMIADIVPKGINCIITKDLSRLGRNYLEVGQYIEDYFPSNGIRYIAIGDNVDTDKGESDLVPFMNIFNEFHAKQTSKKLRQVHEMQCADGECHYTYPPIGYNKREDNKKKLSPDEDSAWIVQKIFELADVEGMGVYSIQRWLAENKVMNPGYREYLRWGAKGWIYENCTEERKYYWDLATIKRLLKNKVYLGHTVRYRSRSISFKNKKRRKNAPEDWSIVLNTHPPLVAEDRFDRVQTQMMSRTRKTKSGEVQMFSGVAKCSDCGRALRYSHNRQRPGHEYQYLSCSSVGEGALQKCTLHYIRYDALQRVVLQRIQELYTMAKLDKEALALRLAKIEQESSASETKDNEKELQRLTERNKEIERLIGKLYEDWVSERLNENLFSSLSARYQEEQRQIAGRIEKIENTMDKPDQGLINAKKWISIIDKITYPTSLSRELITSLIDKIVVHEAVGPKGSRKKTQIVEIHWKFIGCLD